MYKMSKRSIIGRLAILPAFIPVVLMEALLNKAEDWSFSVRKLRRSMERWCDNKFPLDCHKEE